MTSCLAVACGSSGHVEVAPRNPALESVAGAAGESTLSVIASGGEVTCGASSATAIFRGALTATGWLDGVTIIAVIDGAAPVLAGYVAPEEFTGEITRTAAFEVGVAVGEGSHSVLLAFSMAGEGTHPPLNAMAGPFAVSAACATASNCSEEGFFGDVASGHVDLRGGRGEIPVQVKGDLGEDAELVVTGPDGAASRIPLRHSGNSCNYHAKWEVPSTSGRYQLTATGSGHSVVSTVEVSGR